MKTKELAALAYFCEKFVDANGFKEFQKQLASKQLQKHKVRHK